MPEPALIETVSLCRSFDLRRKAEGLMESVKGLFWPSYETLEAVKSLDIRIEPGEMVGFLGPNGAGKTTTLKMLSGLIPPTSGTISVMGFTPFHRETEFLTSISLVMGQKQNLWWDLPPIEAFAIHREIYDIASGEYRKRIDELIAMLEISGCVDIQTRKLSLGQRMRCELAVALLHRPRILFLDEPTIGLDILMQKKIRQFLLDYHDRFGTTMLLTSHYMEDVAALTKRVIVINRGNKVFDGPLTELTQKAKPERLLTVTFNTVPPQFDPNSVGTFLKSEGTRFCFRLPRESVGPTAACLYASGSVLDLIVEEPPLEEAMSELFLLEGARAPSQPAK